MNQQSGTIERVKKMIAQSENIVVLLGIGAVIESGGENIWSSRECYRLEEKYHKSPDEMMSVEYYSARRDKFFEFYKNEIISDVLKPAPLYEDNRSLSDSFNSLFGLAPRTAVASLLAFFAGSTVNARIMSKMKEKSGDKGFGWRAILSSLGGEAVDSLIFFPMVFAGIMPFKGILSLVLTQVICKTLYEVVVLPLTAFIVRIIKKKENNAQYA